LYGPFEDVKPLEFELVRTSFTYPDPYILLTEAQRTIEISHWGNILVAEDFNL
jgi:oligosaccharyltransferase complex subunit alpha (ribophorin I)